ncbi:DNA-processing protein DprA [Thermanaerothrix sp. 4228-RoL]|uniref:DNA-processing protein DprA n=1 Tax=Thermanaerothrix solaris TaxID=3058434 RepID=A0ABU3NL07_9CHLR|nr:DNA-processing protein DprA [Thermanaerothrix sp. 4228-RoL]MDT8897477.1 DNA-processing protein DprA [Thermanaerothrix sp. 4228-RoL]
MDARIYWVAFNHVKGIGAVRMRALLDYFGDLERAWKASPDALRAAGLPPRLVEVFVQTRKTLSLEKVAETLTQKSIQVMTWEDDDYPFLLKNIDQPPPVLYVRGRLSSADQVAVAVVGTRQVSAYGRKVTEQLAVTLAHHGVTVVSGLARGVDALAHEATLNAGGRTLAVLGSGVDVIYPAEHRRLAERILQQGALISDYPPGTPPEANNFPPRNRIISGLAMATVVVEAGEKSGALITATFAAEQGREVFAVPGNINSPSSKGTNRLIANGARPLLQVEEVLDALDIAQVQHQQMVRSLLPGNELEATLLSIIGDQVLSVDEICFLSGLGAEKVVANLAMMELKGLVRNLGGTNFTVLREDSGFYAGG